MKEKIKDFIGDIVEIGTPIEYDTPLYSSEIINSMRHTQLINFLENEFSIVIPIKAINMENFDTINAIGEFIKNMVDNGDQDIDE